MSHIDLHTHTHWSDGSFSPAALVELAHRHSIHTLSVTDHDTTEGLEEALAVGRALGVEIIPGIELSSRFQGRETHVLAYFINHTDPTLQTRLNRLRTTRVQRIQEILHRLDQCGVNISIEDVRHLAGDGSIGRPHIAQTLIHQGHVSGFREAFERYLGTRGKAYVPRQAPEIDEIFAWIREAGGVAIMAHPFWEGYTSDEVDQTCRRLMDSGLQGLEVFYGTFSARQISFNLHLAKRLNLLMTGGSDFHGTYKPEIVVGKGKGSLKVPEGVVDHLRAASG